MTDKGPTASMIHSAIQKVFARPFHVASTEKNAIMKIVYTIVINVN